MRIILYILFCTIISIGSLITIYDFVNKQKLEVVKTEKFKSINK